MGALVAFEGDRPDVVVAELESRIRDLAKEVA